MFDAFGPADFEGIKKGARRDRRTQEPWEELVNCASRQRSRGLPFSPAGRRRIEQVYARAFRVMFFGAGFAEIERNHGGDTRIERGCYGGGITSSGHGAKHDDAARIDLRTLEQKID